MSKSSPCSKPEPRRHRRGHKAPVIVLVLLFGACAWLVPDLTVALLELAAAAITLVVVAAARPHSGTT